MPSCSVSISDDKRMEAVETPKKKRGSYCKFSPENKATIGRYASENGVTKALQCFKEKELKESTVRDWKKAYELALWEKRKSTEPGKAVIVSSLDGKKRGRPPLLGTKLDLTLRERIVAMRERGTPIGSSTVIGIGRGILLKHEKSSLHEFGGPITLNKDWAIGVLRRMQFTKRRANSKAKVLPSNFEEIKEQFLMDIKSLVVMEDIPKELLINWDQTAMKIVPSSSWTMEKRGTKRVEIAAIDDKRQITALLTCTAAGSFLPVQLIYEGTTKRTFPNNVAFPQGWNITCSSNHWSNGDTMIEYVYKILIPYVTEKWKELTLAPDYPALALFDTFKGQCTDEVYDLLDQNNILYVFIPANCTDKLQPLDLSVNKAAKDFMRSKFQKWYGNIICQQLDDGICEEVDLRLSRMKPLSAKWVIEMAEYFTAHSEIILNGFSAAGILSLFSL